MNKFFEKIKVDYFSFESMLEIIFNISAIFLITIIFYTLIEVYSIHSDFTLFMFLIISIFIYYFLARIFFNFPSSLNDKFVNYNQTTLAEIHYEFRENTDMRSPSIYRSKNQIKKSKERRWR